MYCTCKTCIYVKKYNKVYCYLDTCANKKDWIDRIRNTDNNDNEEEEY